MMKIVASLVILGLCANVAVGLAPVSSAQSAAFSSTYLNSSATKIYSAANSTDAANWNTGTAAGTGGTPAATAGGVYNSLVFFGAGASNGTSHVYGVTSSGVTTTSSVTLANTGSADSTVISSLRKRNVNNTIVGWGNDTTQANVISDTAVSASIQAGTGAAWATGPGYLAAISAGPDGTTGTVNLQVWVTLISGTAGSASSTKLTTTADSQTYTASGNVCTDTAFTIGDIWYDPSAGAFFYTYSKYVQSTVAWTTGASTCPSYTIDTYTIYLGGIFVNGTAYWTTPLAITPATATNAVSSLISGPDNSLNATNIIVAYKDTSATGTGGNTGITYSVKTTKATTTTTAGTPVALVSDSTSGTDPVISMDYVPVAVWASNFTYGITVANTTESDPATGTTTYTYTYTNYLNGTTVGVASGLTQPSGTDTLAGFYGWQLNTGYTLLGVWTGAASPYTNYYVLGTFYANGTVNGTQATIGTLTTGGISLYEDVNGTNWIGWQDTDTANTAYTYAGYLAKLQGQLNVPSGASVLSAISAFFALFLAAIFVF